MVDDARSLGGWVRGARRGRSVGAQVGSCWFIFRISGVSWTLLGASWWLFFDFGSSWVPLGCHFRSKPCFETLFCEILAIWGGFGKVLGRCLAHFFNVFLHYLGTLRFCKNIEKTQVFTLFCKSRALKNYEKSTKFDQKSMLI